MFILIIFFPLIAFFVVGVAGRYVGRIGSVLITTGCVAMSSLLSIYAFYDVALSKNVYLVNLGPWFNIGVLRVEWCFLFDTLTVVMLVVVTFVSTLVHIYSIGYISNDPHLPRFMSYLSLFTFFMLMLVTGANLVQIFVGWEGVGLASYLLINFWHTRLQANKSAIKAIVVNRVGDLGLTLAMMVLYHHFHSLDLSVIFVLVPFLAGKMVNFLGFEVELMNLVAFLLFIGAVGKSAQLGLHTWLPDAMEGPTPVSALIHAATMVTAGVFVLVRFSPLLEYAGQALAFIALVGGLTAFFASTVGMLQNDLKRVIAYSTCSQLGYMVFACGMSTYSVAMFHLANHAFFKALLFLGAGSVIHAVSDEQDMRRMGGLVNLLPFTYSIMLIGSMSLMGFPFLTGFYSKDLILEVAATSFSVQGRFVYWLGTVSAFFTAFYSVRLLYLTFFSRVNASRVVVSGVHEPSYPMLFPLIVLTVGSIFFGYFFRDAFVGLGTDFWGNSVFVLPYNSKFSESEFISSFIKIIPVIFSLCGAVISYIAYNYFKELLFQIKVGNVGLWFYRFFNLRWYFDVLYNHFIVMGILKAGYWLTFKALDRGFIEHFGPYGIVKVIENVAFKLSSLQSGYIYHYVSLMMIGVVSFIFLYIFICYDFNFYSEVFLTVIYLLSVDSEGEGEERENGLYWGKELARGENLSINLVK